MGIEEDTQELLGARVRELRKASRTSLRELAGRVGVTAGYLSQIENGNANASIAVIRSIAAAFGMTWLELFEPSAQTGRVLRAQDRPRLYTDGLVAHYGITQAPIGSVEVLISEYAPGQSTGDADYTHGDSQEICLVLRGRLCVQIGGEQHVLEPGDSVELRTSVPHSVTNIGAEQAEAVWIVTPPSIPDWKGRHEAE
jgi:transcriptional regulator with XRE-family HTH domain